MAEAILNFDEDLDIPLFEQVVSTAMSPGSDRATAEAVLSQFSADPRAWTRVDAILTNASDYKTKFYAIQLLSTLIQTRWKTLPRDQCDGIKNYIVNYIISCSSTDQALKENGVILSKLNKTLVDIIKQDWPRHWQGFVPEIVGASKTNEALCANNMEILMILSEEVFDFSRGNLTQAKIRQLKSQFTQEFSMIFDLCQFVLANSSNPSLVKSTLKTLLRFLSWIPLGYIFETGLIDSLLTKFLPVPQLRNITTKCLTEIAGLEADEIEDGHFRELYLKFCQTVASQLGDSDIAAAFLNGSSDDQSFIEDLAMFLGTFFKQHRSCLETSETLPMLSEGHMYLSRIGMVEDIEIFKICLEYWHHLSESLYESSRRYGSGGLMLNRDDAKQVYSQVLSVVRMIMIQRMAKPSEVLVVKDPDTGEIVREPVPDSDALTLYKIMRETLVFLTHLDYEDTHMQMSSMLQRQVDGSEWNHDKLNTLCWAIGSISGACSEENEKRFLVAVIKDLLGLCEMKRGKNHKAVVASNIMYVVGQYPRFLRAHWKFLKTVINKLFEFMHEKHPGVQDMAVDTFLKIADTCKRKFVVQQRNENVPFVSVILDKLGLVVNDLEDEQVQVFYEAVATLIASHTDSRTRDSLTERLMETPNEAWKSIMANAGADVQTLCHPDVVQQILSILKLNHRACIALGHAFTRQLGSIYLDVLNTYKFYTQCVSDAMSSGQRHAGEMLVVRRQRAVKQVTLKLLETYIEKAVDRGLLRTQFLPPLLEAVLGGYASETPLARDAHVLKLSVAIIVKLKEEATAGVPAILDQVFEPTLTMIASETTNFPEIRLEFYRFLRAINEHCFDAFFAMPPETFSTLIDAIVYGFRHTDRAISETALNTLAELLLNVSKDEENANAFFARFFLPLLQEVLAVMTDTMHKSGFKVQATILLELIHGVESGAITAPLSEEQNNVSNPEFLRQHIAQLLSGSFEQLTPTQVGNVVVGMFQLHDDLPAFKNHLRDFLVQLKEFSSQENEELYLEETEAAAKALEEEQAKRADAVPGLLGAPKLPDEMD